VTLSNRVRRWVGLVEVSSLLDGERATMAILVWPQTLPCFFWDVSIFRVVSHNHIFFLARNEYLGVKNLNLPPTRVLEGGHVVAKVQGGGRVVAKGRAKGHVPVAGAANGAPSEIKIEIDSTINWKSL
jgi:hypothetical protein